MKDIPSHTDIKNVILYHHENADGSGPFGKKWTEVPVFARIIHLCDLLDQVCCSDSFDSDTWQKVEAFLQEITGSIADEECIEAFRHAFSEQHFSVTWRKRCGDSFMETECRVQNKILALNRLKHWRNFSHAS